MAITTTPTPATPYDCVETDLSGGFPPLTNPETGKSFINGDSMTCWAADGTLLAMFAFRQNKWNKL